MKDFLGQELNIGDNVVITEDNNFYTAKIEGFTKTLVKLNFKGYGTGTTYIRPGLFKKTSTKLLKIDTILNNLDKPKEL